MKKNAKVSTATATTARVNASIRRDWGEVNPVTKVIPDKRRKPPKHKGKELEE